MLPITPSPFPSLTTTSEDRPPAATARPVNLVAQPPGSHGCLSGSQATIIRPHNSLMHVIALFVIDIMPKGPLAYHFATI